MLKQVSISTRISILSGLIILVTMGVFSAVSLMKQQRDSVDALSRSTLLLSQTAEKILRLSMLKNRRDDISAAIKDIVGNEGIRSVRILNREGIIKFSSRRSELEQHISRTNRLCTNCHAGGDSISIQPISSFYNYHLNQQTGIIYSSLPIYNAPGCYNGDCHATTSDEAATHSGRSGAVQVIHPVHDSSETILGFIEIEVSAKKIMANISRSRTQLIFLSIMIALAASAIAYFSIRFLVGKPVKRLVDRTRRVAKGDFSQQIPPGRAELGVLADSFNHMQRQLLSTQSQLIESEKLASVGKIADEIANDISNPLTGVIIFSESLIEQPELGESNKADCETILQEALKIRESIRNILSLARKEKPNFFPVDIGSLLEQAISIVKKLSNFRNIRIVTATPKVFPKVSADPGLLEQVFLNLLLITSDNMQAGGVMNVSTNNREKDGKIEIRFTDKRGSIAKSILQALSEQVTAADSGDIGRTSISLSVCKDIVALHKGKIYAASETGTGTSIVIELPA